MQTFENNGKCTYTVENVYMYTNTSGQNKHNSNQILSPIYIAI